MKCGFQETFYSSWIPSFISFLYKVVAKQIWIHASCKLNPLIRVYMVLPTLCACKYSYVHVWIYIHVCTYESIHDVIRDVERKKERKTPEAMEK